MSGRGWRRAAPALALLLFASPAAAGPFGPPLDCVAGQDCFVQQWPDLDPGPGATDPFCGTATYDGHDGTDIRVLSMADVARGVPVLALADGIVLRGRDGMEDGPLRSAADRRAVADRECGNGVVTGHGDGIEVQYCHLRRGSVAVRAGERVLRGTKVGEVGSSGLAEFPHVHLTVRRNGQVVDPSTGLAPGSDCLADPAQARPLWDAAAADWLAAARRHILGLGLAGAAPVYERLVIDGPPPVARIGDGATVAWVWLVNVAEGDRVRLRLLAPDGTTFAEIETPPYERGRAVALHLAGRKRPPEPGTWALRAELVRAGSVTESLERQVAVSP